MKRYINQLTVAKKQCEKRIRLLGGPNYEQQEDGAQDEGDGPQSQRVQEEITGTEIPYLSQCEIKIIEIFSASYCWHNEMLSMWFKSSWQAFFNAI